MVGQTGGIVLALHPVGPAIATTLIYMAVSYFPQIYMYHPKQPVWKMGFQNMTEDIFVCVYSKWQYVHSF